MLRFSARLKRKRETAAGRPEVMLPHARVHDGAFLVHVDCFIFGPHGAFTILATGLRVPAVSEDRIDTLADAVTAALPLPGTEPEIYYKHTHLGAAVRLGNCGIGRSTRLVALYNATPDLGVALYRAGQWRRAAAILEHFLVDPDGCHKSDYAPFLADIYMRSVVPSLASVERAAALYLVAAHSCDASVLTCLARLSRALARKLAAARARLSGIQRTLDDYAADALGVLAPDLIAELRRPEAAHWANTTSVKIRRLCRYYLDVPDESGSE